LEKKNRGVFESKLGSKMNTWDQLAAKFSVVTLEEGEHFVTAGQFCFIQGGLLLVYYVDSKGHEINQNFYKTGEMISPISVPNSDPCQFYIQCIEPCTLIIASYEEMSHLNFDDSEWVRLELIFLDSVFVRNTKREARLLLGNANRRYA